MRNSIVLLLLAGLLFLSACSEDDTTAPEPLEMQDAIDKVTDDILPDVLPAGAKYNCIRMDKSLIKGTVIEEDVPVMRGTGQRAPHAVAALAEESYFFLLDLAPNTFYAHPVKYIVVGKSGKHQVTDAAWWPLINGEPYSQFMKAVPDADHVISGNVPLVQAAGSPFQFAFGSLGVQFADGFIPVQGLMPDEALFDDAQNTYLSMINFCNAYRDATFNTLVDGLVQGGADDILTAIDGMVSAGKNVITIMIIAHGGVDGVSLGGVGFSAADFAAKMSAHPTVRFNFLLGSCHSGSFLDNMQALSNVQTFHSACTSAGGAAPDWDTAGGMTDYNASDAGSEWFSSVLDAGGRILANSTYWNTIQTMAVSEGVPVTSMLMHESCYGALGLLPTMGLSQDLDLSHRAGETSPQGFAIWEVPGR